MILTVAGWVKESEDRNKLENPAQSPFACSIGFRGEKTLKSGSTLSPKE